MSDFNVSKVLNKAARMIVGVRNWLFDYVKLESYQESQRENPFYDFSLILKRYFILNLKLKLTWSLKYIVSFNNVYACIVYMLKYR